MNKQTVYRFELYDITHDEWKVSRRWATKAAIKRVCGRVVGGGVEVDESVLGVEIGGMTARNFDPHAFTGFPRQI